MKILYYCEGDSGNLLSALQARLPSHDIIEWSADSVITKSEITAAIAWMPPEAFFDDLPNLTHVYAVAAGVDHFMKTAGLPADVDVIRLTDAGMGQQMAEYVLYGVLHAQRQMHEFQLAQLEKRWAHHLDALAAADTRIGILGAGQLGGIVAERLALNRFTVSCWSRGQKTLPANVASVFGAEALPGFASNSDILVCLLPLTVETTGILNGTLFEQMPRGAFVINPGRGGHLVDKDLQDALDTGQLSGAMLDVFHEEPLPDTHPFWEHPRVLITPHIAAKSLVNESADQIADSIACVARGEQPAGLVDRHRGY